MIFGKIFRDGISNETNSGNSRSGEDREVIERVEIAMVWAHGKDG